MAPFESEKIKTKIPDPLVISDRRKRQNLYKNSNRRPFRSVSEKNKNLNRCDMNKN